MINKPRIDKIFWKNQKVLITGHTGFKGSWLSLLLSSKGINVSGISLPAKNNSLFDKANIKEFMDYSFLIDIRNRKEINKALNLIKPSIVFHFAAQPLVLESYKNPLETWDINVMGTLNLLEEIRLLNQNCILVIITTDKVYKNKEWFYGYREVDELGGHDPYSSSKAAVELAVESWIKSFFSKPSNRESKVRVATARAGNVIGGGDWAENRLVPDVVRALTNNEKIQIRNPNSIRPWQHVLDPLFGYILLAEKLNNTSTDEYDMNKNYDNSYNFGPYQDNNKNVIELVKAILKYWPGKYEIVNKNIFPHEAKILQLDISKSINQLSWEPLWNFDKTVKKTICWYKNVNSRFSNPIDMCLEDINDYFS